MNKRVKKQKFYNRAYIYLILGLVIIFIGFSQSYFFKLKETTLVYHIHGISATFWMTLLIIQPLLYTLGNLKIHKKLGWISIMVVPVLLLAGIEMMRLMILGQENYPPNIVYNLAFIDAFTLLGFVVLYGLAIYHRKNIKLHARFMVSTIFAPLVPALTRVFFAFQIATNFHDALTYSYLFMEFVILIIIWKERKSPELKYTYIPVFITIVAMHLLMYYADKWDWWISLMNNFAGYNV